MFQLGPLAAPKPTPHPKAQRSQSRQAGAAIDTRGSRSERDLRHSIKHPGGVQAPVEAGRDARPLFLEEAMNLSTKLKITAVMATVLMAVVWTVPVPV